MTIQTANDTCVQVISYQSLKSLYGMGSGY